MAEKKPAAGKAATTQQYIGFMLGDDEFNAPISLIQEIVELPAITFVPNLRPYVEGVMNLRGQVVPVVDLKKRLGLGERSKSADNRVIVFRDKGRVVGFIVNAITQVYDLAENQIEPPSEILLARNAGQFVCGISKLQGRLPMLLDIPRILDASKSEYAEKKYRLAQAKPGVQAVPASGEE